MTLGDPCPPRKFLVTRLHPTYADPYSGQDAIANAIYWPVKFRSATIKYAIDFLDKYGAPWLDVKYDGALPSSQKTELLTTLKNSIRHGIVLHADTSEINPLLTSDSKSIDNYIKFIDMLNLEIDMAILGNNLTTEVKGGSFAAATALSGIRDDIVQECIRMIENTWNQLIEWICWYNFPHGIALPKFKLYKNYPPTEEQARIIVAMDGLKNVRFKFTKEYFQRVLGIGENEFEIENVSINEMQQTNNINKSIVESGIESKDNSSNKNE
jgi:phage gp29-like protein